MPPTLEGFSDEMRFYRSFSSWNIQFGNIFFPNLLLKIHFHGIHLCVTEKESIGAEGIAELPTVAARVLAEGLASQERLLERYVVDWSLKTRVRFTSKTPFPCSSTLKVHVEGPDARSLSLSFFEEELLLTRFFLQTSEEASGITGFVRRVPSPGGADRSESSLDTSPNAQFHGCCLYWQHPWLPWLSTFPRDTPAPVATSSLTFHVGADAKIAKCLLDDWCRPPLPFSLFFLPSVHGILYVRYYIQKEKNNSSNSVALRTITPTRDASATCCQVLVTHLDNSRQP